MKIAIQSLVCTCIVILLAELADAAAGAPELVSVEKIWSAAPHNAFTDLVRWNERFYCAFREGKGHGRDIGKLRIIVSRDGNKWESAGLLTTLKYDLRDAALSVTPDGRLMVLGGAQTERDGKPVTGTFVSFSKGKVFTEPEVVIPLGRWLWRVTWHKSVAYGVSYGHNDGRPASRLHMTTDGRTYKTVGPNMLDDGEWPTEARVRFDEDGTAYCLHRRDGASKKTAQVGISKPPYKEWQWRDLGRRFGGPNFLRIPDGRWIATGRLYDGRHRTEICQLDVKQGKLTPILALPSGGDTSYPGMVWHDDMLWISYYSSHEGRTSIYLAKVRFPT